VKKSIKLFCFVILALLTFSCHSEKAKIRKYQELTILVEKVGNNDSILFKKFEREENIHLNIIQLPKQGIIKYLIEKKYQTSVDVILFDSYPTLLEAKQAGLLTKAESSKLESQVDPVYHSQKKTWFALSKSPIVLIYNKNLLSRDTIQNYYQLISPCWKGQIAFQNRKSKTLEVFDEVIRLVLKEKANAFLTALYKQNSFAHEGDDARQIKRIFQGEAKLALIQLSSLAKFYAENEQYRRVVLPIFPNQRKKGAYISITGAAIYKYTGDYQNAVKLLEFLASKRAQYQYAAGRYETPVLKGVQSCYEINLFGKFRGRFYHRR
jgi:iron(III) transport system substrate-binding protein